MSLESITNVVNTGQVCSRIVLGLLGEMVQVRHLRGQRSVCFSLNDLLCPRAAHVLGPRSQKGRQMQLFPPLKTFLGLVTHTPRCTTAVLAQRPPTACVQAIRGTIKPADPELIFTPFLVSELPNGGFHGMHLRLHRPVLFLSASALTPRRFPVPSVSCRRSSKQGWVL